MALIVQDDTGEIEDANSYQSVEDFREYHAAVGTVLSSYTDLQIEHALIKATRYLDIRHKYVGRKLLRDQTTEWPRRYVDWEFGRFYNRIDPEVVKATAEYAFRALTNPLLPDPSRDEGGRRASEYEYEVPGDIREEFRFVQNSDLELPEYRTADLAMKRARLIRTGSEVIRS